MVRRNRRDIASARVSPPPKPVTIKAREPPMVPCLLERSNVPETMMGYVQGWPACPSEDPKDVPPEPENSPPSDVQGCPACPAEELKDVPAEPLMIPPGDAMDKSIVQRDPLNMRRSDRIKQPPKYLNDYCCK